jgi:peptidyl-prolyl cis-trans isomerase C
MLLLDAMSTIAPGTVWLKRLGIAALLALTLGAAQAPAADEAPHRDPLVARVNDHELRLSDVFESIGTLALGDQIEAREQIDTYIEAMINEEMLFQWALDEDFGGDDALRKAVKDLVVRHLIDKHVRSQIKVSEGDARAYYDAHPSQVRGEHVRVRRILLPERERCEQLKRQIATEDDFIAAARKMSLDKSTRDSGGDLGLMMRSDEPSDGYEARFFEMKQGEMRVFDVPQGCMLVRSVYYVNPPLPPFSAVREQILQYLHNRQEAGLVNGLFQEASKSSKVQRYYRTLRIRATIQRVEPGGAGGTSR